MAREVFLVKRFLGECQEDFYHCSLNGSYLDFLDL